MTRDKDANRAIASGVKAEIGPQAQAKKVPNADVAGRRTVTQAPQRQHHQMGGRRR